MASGQRKVGSDKDDVVAEVPAACADETTAVEFMEKRRWGDNPKCPRCDGSNVYQMRDRKTGERNRRYLWRCRMCGEIYTVRIGTVFEDSRIPLRHWCYAFWRACTSKKGVSALEIKRHTGLTYKSALFMMHRIRYAMAPALNGDGPLGGTVEVDETYVGGKPRYKHQSKAGRGTCKQPVIALVERDGRVNARVIADVTGRTLKSAIREMVDQNADIVTDELASYRGLEREFASHTVIRHIVGNYVDGEIHTNTAESFFSLVKRALIGIWHNVSKKHLHRYIAECEFRWNGRKLTDGARTSAAIYGAQWKRLIYKPIPENGP
jgi:transposase-like protein